ncbi:cytoskeleton-associated protein 2-like [Thrips palmi]|uniref:Cytoskeleton-associated protein 2-like n=1 Tax=Thrips palmi TaxID=161013 RepID=A0A6P9AAQ2_THRPL|nr:cytoskeleton-associated protein 2-like [Thrips palmi]
MPPVAKRTATTRTVGTAAAGRLAQVVQQAQPTVPTRFTSVPMNSKDQVQQFREARKLREQERLEKLRNCRLKNSSNSSLSSFSFRRFGPDTSKVSSCSSSHATESNKSALSMRVHEEKKRPRVDAHPSTSSCTVRENKVASSRLRRSIGGRKSILKSKCSKLKASKAEVKLTKTTQLRMLKADPLLQLSNFKATASSKKMILPAPEPLRQYAATRPIKLFGDGKLASGMNGSKPTETLAVTSTTPKKPLGIVSLDDGKKPQTPSRIPVKKASFVSPLKQTPKPSPLRERLASWLEKRNHSLDNFKHLKCFGVLGPAVKRPQTPFRKVLLSTSLLKAIPESKESTPNKDISEDPSGDDSSPLNTTFTLEEEDKENICSPTEPEENASAISVAEQQTVKELDQAHGVLSELHKLIQMGYPIEQCSLWLRAVRRRFPQCGDEPTYWECLAALEEARGDLQTAVSCYERAILQGAEESSVQSSLDELLKKMSSLHIEPVLRINRESVQKIQQNKLLDSSNIIKSSSIQFAVKEKCTPSKKIDASDDSDTLFTATPVRRSGRLAGTPKQGTPGLQCVKSLEFLEPNVRRSLVFHTNSALEPED